MEKVFKAQKLERQEMTIAEAKPLLIEIEMEKYLNSDQISKDAIQVKSPILSL
jgi:ATP-dependent HslUV protease ATP-binding subunit HslU